MLTLAVGFAFSSPQAMGAEKEQGLPAGSGSVVVNLKGAVWKVESRFLRVVLDSRTLSLRVVDKVSRTEWNSRPSTNGDLTVLVSGKPAAVALANAETKTAKPTSRQGLEGFRVALSNWQGSAAEVAISFLLPARTPDLIVRVEPGARGGDAVGQVSYPPPFTVRRRASEYAVLPLMQGILLPGTYTREWHVRHEFNSCWLTMPWFGAVKDGSAYIAILTTRYDAAMQVDNPAGGPPTLNLIWLTSLGKLGYPREVRYTFFSRGNYVTLADAYRKFTQSLPAFKRNLSARRGELPLVGEVSKALWLDISLMEHIERHSGPAIHVMSADFNARAKQLKRMKDLGLNKVVTRLMGWEVGGFAALCPDHLPPCPEAGGWDGLRGISQTCRQLGYVLGLHFNFFPLAKRAPSYDESKVIISQAGQPEEWWDDGTGLTQALSDRYGSDFAARTFKELRDHGVEVGSIYLDQYDAVELLEDFAASHPQTREQCAEYRAQVMKLARQHGAVVSSEYGADWAVPYLDQIFRVPPTEIPEGIPVPLYNIVHGDRLIIRQAVNSPEETLFCIAFGFAPRTGLARTARDDYPPESLVRQWQLPLSIYASHIGDRVVDHEFLSPDFQQFRTTFASGAKVEVDLRQRSYRLVGLRGFDDRVQQFPEAGLRVRVNVVEFKHTHGREFEFRLRYRNEEQNLEPDLFADIQLRHALSTQGEHIVTSRSETFAVPSVEWKPGMVIEGRTLQWTLPEPWGPGEYDLVFILFRRGETNRIAIAGPRSELGGLPLLGKVIVKGWKEIEDIHFIPADVKGHARREAAEVIDMEVLKTPR